MEQLEIKFKKIGYTPNTGRVAIKTLEKVLYTGEELHAIIECVYSATIGVLVVSNHRVFYIGNNLYKKMVYESFPYSNINTIQFINGRLPFTGSIEILTNNRIIKFKACIPAISETIVDTVIAIKEKSFKVA